MREIALDIHKHYAEGAELLEGGGISRFRIENSRDDWIAFAQTRGRGARIVIEATGNSWWIHDIIRPWACEVLVANPLQLKAIAHARIKTDKLDAEVLVRLLHADFIPTVWVPTPEVQELRALLRYREQLVSERRRVKNRIHSLLLSQGITFKGSNLFGRKGREFLANLEVQEVPRQLLDSNLHLYQTISQEILLTDQSLAEKLPSFPLATELLKIPGVGLIAAMTVAAEIGDINRFPSAKHLTSYAGLVPGVHQSGTARYTGHITKAGRRLLRTVLVQAAHAAVRSPGYLQRMYRRLRSRKGAAIAIVAVARKLLSLIWVFLTGRGQYPEERNDLTVGKERKRRRLSRPYPDRGNEWRLAALSGAMGEPHEFDIPWEPKARGAFG